VLLLHGYPQNHLMWRQVAPALAQDHTVVLADLRGYGDSDKPVPDAAGDVYSKRSMARDHFLPEEAPELVIEALRDFLRLPSGP
jgi:haloacetate dehalogenase